MTALDAFAWLWLAICLVVFAAAAVDEQKPRVVRRWLVALAILLVAALSARLASWWQG